MPVDLRTFLSNLVHGGTFELLKRFRRARHFGVQPLSSSCLRMSCLRAGSAVLIDPDQAANTTAFAGPDRNQSGRLLAGYFMSTGRCTI
jgi:hypothetical protein